MADQWKIEARNFIEMETQFHLGALPTEKAHPRTRGLAEITKADTAAGIRLLQDADQDIVVPAETAFSSCEFQALVDSMTSALVTGKRICFSGCGATGRLCLLLESAYRNFWRADFPRIAAGHQVRAAICPRNAVIGIMTGGDYALVRSVEGFEDYQSFGRHQVIELGFGSGDVFVSVNEGGETSSVIGSTWAALEAGAKVFFACNNPASALLEAKIERSSRVMKDERFVKLDLSCGPMAILGSTRMQAATIHLLVLGAALELALGRFLSRVLPNEAQTRLTPAGPEGAYAAEFSRLLQSLSGNANVEILAEWTEREEAIYRSGAALTYFGHEYFMDIFTDTTERAPTFSLPPFRKHDDVESPRPFAFVKNPLLPVADAWTHMLNRSPRCLDWAEELYRRLGAGEKILRRPPRLGKSELLKFLIGNEDDPSRYSAEGDAAALIVVGSEARHLNPRDGIGGAFEVAARPFHSRAILAVGPDPVAAASDTQVFRVRCDLRDSPLRLWDHLAIKMVLNTISTATAARLGYIRSNLMEFVETTNKKLIDRGTRLIAESCKLDYSKACEELFATKAWLDEEPIVNGVRLSPVAVTIDRLRRAEGGKRMP